MTPRTEVSERPAELADATVATAAPARGTSPDAAEAGARDDALTVLQALADPVRWTVLDALAEQPRCVCDIQERVPVAGNLLSYHLKVLRDCGLVTTSRRGRWVDYSLAPDARGRMVASLPGAGGTP